MIRQSIYAVIGIALMLAIARVDYSRFRELRVGLYTAMISTILLVLVVGGATRGTRRWIEFPFFTFQPSELGKVLLVAALAGFAIDRLRRTSERQRTARLLLLGLAPAALIFLQPDLGTGMVYGVITLAVLYIAGVKWTHFAAVGATVLAAVTLVLVIAPAVGLPVLKGYQQERLTSFLNPSEDPRDSSYQINQALIAVGSGGKTGRGDEATQAQSGFLPERHTDFIFAVVGERFGFVGAAFLLSLYALLIWRALRILTLSKNLYGSDDRRGHRGDADVPGLRQCRHGRWDHADHGDPLAVDELRRFLRARHLHGPRDCSRASTCKRSSPPEAEAQLLLL